MTIEEIDKQIEEKFYYIKNALNYAQDANYGRHNNTQWFEFKSFIHQIIKQTHEADALVTDGIKKWANDEISFLEHTSPRNVDHVYSLGKIHLAKGLLLEIENLEKANRYE